MDIKSFTFNAFSENTYVLYDNSHECVIIDPGCCNSSEEQLLAQFIDAHQLLPVKLLYTHCHIDHVLGNYFVNDKYKLTGYAHPSELALFHAVPTYAGMYGFAINEWGTPPIHKLGHGDVIEFGTTSLQCIFAPGHSPGSICFYNIAGQVLIGGDVLFHESIGRTDLPGGNHQQLLQSIESQLYTLPDEVVVYAGHMEPTTIGHEKRYNPFVRG